MAGYSGTPLARKLGIKAGARVRTQNAPAHYPELLEPLPPGVLLSSRLTRDVDVYHLFTRSRRELAVELPKIMHRIRQHGMIWVSWPKKACGVASELLEDDVRREALPLGLVDVKVCAVDQIWSGLKLVIRKENRRPDPDK